jgi:heme iron utilization protein
MICNMIPQSGKIVNSKDGRLSAGKGVCIGKRKDWGGGRKNISAVLGELFTGQKPAVLSSLLEGRPYGNPVAFAAERNFRNFIFATTRATRKFFNILQDPRVSLVIDNRSNRTDDFREAAAAKVLGRAALLEEPEKEGMVSLFLTKHPYLEEFVRAPTCALFQIRAERCLRVCRFQNVVEPDLTP